MIEATPEKKNLAFDCYYSFCLSFAVPPPPPFRRTGTRLTNIVLHTILTLRQLLLLLVLLLLQLLPTFQLVLTRIYISPNHHHHSAVNQPKEHVYVSRLVRYRRRRERTTGHGEPCSTHISGEAIGGSKATNKNSIINVWHVISQASLEWKTRTDNE